ncbi:hypothetical protein [Janibacter sp. HTCC2649]|uniref:hypothetical protein n=1 Tax=Janibacter sp. HTCC2649 TaxID=313589 RepID=UPI00030B5ADD|nr:hypothetical protein [Janibacter sp. HTCC2649]
MGNETFHVVPADMDADAAKWGSAADSLGKAHRAVPALGVSFGGFQTVVGTKYSEADLAVQNMIELGEGRLRATSTNVTHNIGRTKKNDDDAGKSVSHAGAGGGGGDRGPGTGTGTGPGSGENGGEPSGGKGKDHYAQLLNDNPMPTDPKDPEITFDRHVDEKTGEVSWTPREMKPGEGSATDGRDVERIPERADRIVVTMVDGEPRITYVDTDADDGGGPRPSAQPAGAHWQAADGSATGRVVAGSGAQEPGAATLQPNSQTQAQPQTEWSRPLPDGADVAVVEVRDGEPHLVFLDVNGGEVTQVSDTALTDHEFLPVKESQR